MDQESDSKFNLSPAKRALLDALLKERNIDLSSRSVIQPRRSIEPAPLSFAQQRMWFLHRLEGSSEVYNVNLAYRVRGDLDLEALENSINRIIERHEILRTHFNEIDGEVRQVVETDFRMKINLHDLSAVPVENLEEKSRQILVERGKKWFDLTQCPLLRVDLIRLGEDAADLLITFHHILIDEWSMGVFLRELREFYQEQTQGIPARITELPIQYADFSAWQLEWLKGKLFEKQLAYWKEALQGAPSSVDLQTDYPRPPAKTYAGSRESYQFPLSLLEKLRQLSRAERVTLFTTLLSAFNVLLYRYTGQKDIVVGSPIANRRQIELENLVGFFLNTLVLRADLSGGITFRHLLRQMNNTVLDAFDNQDLPFEWLVDELKPERDLSRNPLFQISFVVQNINRDRFNLPGLELTPISLNLGWSKFDLSVFITEHEHGLKFSLEYSTDLFSKDTIDRLATNFETLLHGLTANPDESVDRLPIASNLELHKVLVDWNATFQDFPTRHLVHQLVEDQVVRDPSAIAVVLGDLTDETVRDQNSLNYTDLNKRANRLAHFLIARGIGDQSLVGVSLRRSTDMVVTLLGILKAGAAYLPLDPAYPAERLNFMVRDAGLPLVITETELSGNLDNLDLQVIRIDQQWDEIGQYSHDNPEIQIDPSARAYVIYTSGSTGEPKGVELSHYGLLNLVQWHIKEFGVTRTDRATQVAGLSFDASVWEIWPYLATGACVFLLHDERELDPSRLIDWLVRNRITISFLPTPIAESVLDEDWPRETSLRILLTGGDRLHRYPPAGLPFRLINNYGPTECTVVATSAEVQPLQSGVSSQLLALPSIGRPISNVHTYVLDPNMNPVPIGAPGELYIGGRGVGRGYLNRPELTSERFIADPFARGPNQAPSRLYRTGDLVRYLSDGRLEFLGRLDDQVKLRGLRIELGEIETILSQHPQVDQVAVTLRQMDHKQYLAAYLVLRESEVEPRAAAFRSYLTQKLPDYMLPEAYVFLESIPLTPNGKVDRKALPDPEFSSAVEEKGYLPPQDDLERQLCQVWESVLGVERVGREDNFFALGGHSLLAIRLVSKIEEQMGRQVPLAAVFQTPTVSGLAERLRQPAVVSVRPIIARKNQAEPAPLSFGQERMWFQERLGVVGGAYNVPMAFHLSGRLSCQALENSINQIIKRHNILRTTFQEIEGENCQVVAPELQISVQTVDLSDLPEAERKTEGKRRLKEWGQEPFDLEKGPLLRVYLIVNGESDYDLLLNLHHVVIDEWSAEVLLRELAFFYKAEILGDRTSLPDLPIQYGDFAAWQLEILTGSAGAAQLNYWKAKLAGVPQVLELPLDHPRPALYNYRGGIRSCRLSGAHFDEVVRFSRAERITLFTLLLAAFQILLYRLSGQEEFLVGSPIANRRQPELENLVGFFLNTLVFPARFKNPISFRDYLFSLGKSVFESFDFQDLPFEKLVEEMRPQRDLSRQPLFQVAFAFHPISQRSLQLEGLEIEPIRLDYGWSKFDLTLFVTERSDALDLRMEYSSDLFDPGTIDRLLDCLVVLLQSALRTPDLRVDDLPLLGEAEQKQILFDWNATWTDYPRHKPVHQLVEDQVLRTPQAVALRDEIYSLSLTHLHTSEMTFLELNRCANQLAHYLRSLGVVRHSLVGISMKRSPEMVIAMLAVLKAGAAYVPLDPTYPQDRLAFMVEDTSMEILISLGEWSQHLPSGKVRIVHMDDDWAVIGECSAENLNNVNASADLAYLMYTSGSTGQPKGIGIPHQAILRLVCNTDYVRIEQGDRIVQASNMSFDAATFEVWGALVNGGCLVIAPQEVILNPGAFVELLRREKIQTMFLTTALFNQIAMTNPSGFSTMRDVMFGGEAVTPGWVRAVLESGKPARLLHVYGPTESTTFTTCYSVEKVEKTDFNVPIGKPIANTSIYVLDRRLNPVPVGASGELFIGGDGLAWGYYDRPELTAERFLPNPFAAPGERMYSTGDLVRYLPDGNIEFLGRIDNQVKLRGFRVELGEIESALTAHPAIAQAAVLLHSSSLQSSGERQLVAYVVPHLHSEVNVQVLRAHLKSRLPDYMVPAFYIFLDELPLNPNGKIDRNALPKPASYRAVSEASYVAPRDELETRLCQLWEQVLEIKQISIHDNFFDLGGHSLLAVRLFTQIEQEMCERLPLATLFQSPTIAELADVLRKERQAAEWHALVAIQEKGSRPPFYCVHNFGGEALDLEPLARAFGADQPFFGLQALGLDGIQKPHTSIEEMAAYYVKAIRQHQPHGPYYLGGYCFGGVVAYEMACHLRRQGEQVNLVAAIDASAPGYARIKGIWSPRQIWGFFANLPLWVRDFFAMDTGERRVVVQRRFKRISKSLARRVGIPAEMTTLEIIGEHVHVMEAPLHRRSLMELHMQAIQNYVTPEYDGKVTAIRVRRMPLFSRQAFDMGWSQVAHGGVDLRLVPGAHHNIMRPPYVQELARQIRESMDQPRQARA